LLPSYPELQISGHLVPITPLDRVSALITSLLRSRISWKLAWVLLEYWACFLLTLTCLSNQSPEAREALHNRFYKGRDLEACCSRRKRPSFDHNQPQHSGNRLCGTHPSPTRLSLPGKPFHHIEDSSRYRRAWPRLMLCFQPQLVCGCLPRTFVYSSLYNKPLHQAHQTLA